jgi:diguanylate cyclase (GGDEF)-like protein
LSFLDKVPYAVKKAIEEKRLLEEKKETDSRLLREKTISEALIQSVVNGVIFINSKGIIEKINVTLENFLGKGIVQLGKNICELPEGNLVRAIFLKPFEKEACWEIKQCHNEECPMFGRRDCLCWFNESACIVCSGITDETERLNFLLNCEVYKKAQENYYAEPVELEHNGRFLHIYRRNVMDERGALIGEILDVVDMTPEKDFREQLRVLSITDPLTGLHNRRYITQRIMEEFHESKRYGRDLSIMIIDIDNFKSINDTYGHPAGDEVLRQLAGILEGERRKSDVVGRYGGEEFVIIMPHTKKQEAAVMAERLRKKIKAYAFNTGSEKSSLTISIGVSSLTENIYDMDDLLKIADKALYQAKGQGKNKVVVL